ncbi:MAG: DUF86 domain-containing protein [Acidobacteriia bacterium]|nr:DUF86 domain-containing protein [Terriglobia bacterium]
MRRDSLRLLDIVGAADAASGYAMQIDHEQFLAGGVGQDAILRQLTVAGEAACKLSPEFQLRHPQIPWHKIIGFRHRVVHDYFGLDLDAVWKIATVELPMLRAQVWSFLRRQMARKTDRHKKSIENRRQFLEVSGDLAERMDPIFVLRRARGC